MGRVITTYIRLHEQRTVMRIHDARSDRQNSIHDPFQPLPVRACTRTILFYSVGRVFVYV